jgi:hypothetical protein
MLLEEATRQTAHLSFFRRRLERLARGAPLTEWLVAELNLRGYLGATGVRMPDRAPAAGVSVEALLVALAMPHTEADGRLFKLMVRTLQRGPIDVERLARLARRERADTLLAWLLAHLPESERTPTTDALAARLAPRVNAEVTYRYDFERLVRRPATRERLWRTQRG